MKTTQESANAPVGAHAMQQAVRGRLTSRAIGRHALAGRHAEEGLGEVAAGGRVPRLHGRAPVAHGLLDDPAGRAPLLLAQLGLVVVHAGAARIGKPPKLLHRVQSV